MYIVKNRKIFYTFSGVLIVLSIIAMFAWGFSFGIDFKGGSSVEFAYAGARPSVETVQASIDSLNFDPSIKGLYTLVPTGDTGYILNLRTVNETERAALTEAIKSTAPTSTSTVKANNINVTPVATGTISITATSTPVIVTTTNAPTTGMEIKKFNSVGPTLGQEAAAKSIESIILVILAIVLFLTFAFRKVSKPVSSWKYGIVSIIALCHDVIIPTGVFIALNHFFGGYEIDTLFVTAILVILGFSIHDTIVVFDRVRENLKHDFGGKTPKSFEAIVGESISQTFVRSINTSATTLLAILVVFLVGPAATKNFSLTLLVGIFFGTYSSIFIGSNLLVTLEKMQAKKAVSKK